MRYLRIVFWICYFSRFSLVRVLRRCYLALTAPSWLQLFHFVRQIVIAFTYWQRGELVSCKYRYLTKKFFQVHVIQIPFLRSDMNNSLSLSRFLYLTCFLCLCFLQEKNTRRIFYGLDDIEKSSEIIIVRLPLPSYWMITWYWWWLNCQ